jgi:hypothetical protein
MLRCIVNAGLNLRHRLLDKLCGPFLVTSLVWGRLMQGIERILQLPQRGVHIALRSPGSLRDEPDKRAGSNR